MPYGAYELKARYQQHLLFAMGLTFAFVCLVLASAWAVSILLPQDTIVTLPDRVGPTETIIDIPPPPPIERSRPQTAEEPLAGQTRVGIPTPVSDEDAGR